MDVYIFDFLFSGIVFFIYGFICIINLIFTFSLPLYRKIEEILNLEIFKSTSLKPWEININRFDILLKRHNIIAGPLLIILAIIDIRLWFDIIWFF